MMFVDKNPDEISEALGRLMHDDPDAYFRIHLKWSDPTDPDEPIVYTDDQEAELLAEIRSALRKEK